MPTYKKRSYYKVLNYDKYFKYFIKEKKILYIYVLKAIKKMKNEP